MLPVTFQLCSVKQRHLRAWPLGSGRPLYKTQFPTSPGIIYNVALQPHTERSEVYFPTLIAGWPSDWL